MLRRVVYSSTAAQSVTVADVHSLIRGAHNRNSRAGITGGLLFLDGYFFQVVEGIPSAVEKCLRRVFRDPRHHTIVIRRDELVTEPLFPSEWMALRDGSEIDPEVLSSYNYEPGMAPDRFEDNEVLAFIMACFDRELLQVYED
jgi:hypothetical protein